MTEVAFSDLNTWLGSQPVNTADTPYEIIVTGLVVSDIGSSATSGTLGYIIRNNSTKYVDLHITELPSGVTNMSYTFSDCTSLVNAPVIPSGVTNMSYTFTGCTSLMNKPTIPNGVTTMLGTFKGCTSLVTAPVIPDSVITIQETFSNCASLVKAPVIPDSVLSIYGTFQNCTSLVTAPVIPYGITEMNVTFNGCTSLVNAPIIPDSITKMNYTFQNCTSLVNAPIIPDSITEMKSTFNGCTSLTHKPIIPSTVTTSTNCYNGVTTPNWKGTQSQAESFLSTFFAQTTDSELRVYNNDRVTLEDTIHNIDISTLSTYLAGLDPNTVDTAYKVYIRGLTTSNYNNISTALTSNRTKYVDLSTTRIPGGVTDMSNIFRYCISLINAPAIPNGVTDMSYTFEGCTSLVTAPVIPNSVTNMRGTFDSCSSLVNAPVIPDSVTNMQSTFLSCRSLVNVSVISNNVTIMSATFRGCTSLVNVPAIPNSVTDMQYTFYGCTSLRKIDEFNIPLNTLKNNSNFKDMFKNCTSLESIGFKVDTDKWHAWRLKFDGSSVEGKVFGIEQGQVVSTAIQNTQISQDDIKLPVLTDELWFPFSSMSDSDIEDVIVAVLNNRYTYWKKAVIDPTSKSLVMMAADPNNVVSNFLGGGGGGGGFEKLVISTTRSVNVSKDMRIFADGSGITVTLNFDGEEGCVAEVYAIQNCTLSYYTGASTTQSLSMVAGTRVMLVYFNGWKYNGTYGAVWN